MALFSLQDLETYCTVFYPLFFFDCDREKVGWGRGRKRNTDNLIMGVGVFK